MNCPYCNKEMKDGFLNTKGGLIFSKDKFLVNELPHRSKSDITFLPFTRRSHDACYCENCGCCIIRKKR